MQIVVVDTAQIQPYIFGSNRLRENVGASYLAAMATDAWALQAVMRSAPRHNVLPGGRRLDPGPSVLTDALDAEVLYAGGGNCVVLFGADATAQDAPGRFVEALSVRAIEDAPGLRLVFAQRAFDPARERLCTALAAAMTELGKVKRAAPAPAPLLGLGVTMMCRATGLPAVGYTPKIRTDRGYPASAEILAKVDAALPRNANLSAADRRLRDHLPAPAGFDYPRDFDDLGRDEDDFSYIAVVHADGNGMGTRFANLATSHGHNDLTYRDALRALSQGVDAAAIQALRATLDLMAAKFDRRQGRYTYAPAGEEITTIQLRRARRPEREADPDQAPPDADAPWYLPFRPIVFGGDDLTFVCDGRLGLALAVEYLRQFRQATANLPDGAGSASACAGVAIVKTHYPFARAYDLAESLGRSAKAARHDAESEGAWLDWHVALGGLAGDIDEIRRREYTGAAGTLTLRPVALDGGSTGALRHWNVVHAGVTAFQGTEWVGRHNKVKALRDALREGPNAVTWFIDKFNQRQPLPTVAPSYSALPTQGWADGHCAYFDAVELADWYMPIGQDVASSGQGTDPIAASQPAASDQGGAA